MCLVVTAWCQGIGSVVETRVGRERVLAIEDSFGYEPLKDMHFSSFLKDNFGNKIGTGGEILYLFVCKKDCSTDSQFPVGENYLMQDMGNGDYEYVYQPQEEGELKFTILQMHQGNIKAEYSNSLDPSEVYGVSNMTSMSYNWGSGPLWGSKLNNVAITMEVYLKIPATDNYTLKVNVDDVLTLYLDNDMLFTTQYPTVTTWTPLRLEGNRLYYLKMIFQENVGPAQFSVKWSSSTISEQVISSNLLLYPAVIQEIQGTIKCLDGYLFDSFQGCLHICGDGIRTSEEACDDKNHEDGDGCAKDCSIIEQNYTCKFSQSEQRDICKHQERVSDKIQEINTVTTSINCIIGICVVSNLISSLFFTGSSQSMFSPINLLQLMFLFPLLRVYLPVTVLQFYEELEWSSFSFGFLTLQDRPFLKDALTQFSESETDDILNLVGISYKSSLLNLLSPISTFLMLLIPHILIISLYCCCRSTKRCEKVQKIIKKLYYFLTFKLYIRSGIQLIIFASISTLTEVQRFDYSCTVTVVSLLLAFIFLFCILALILTNALVWLAERNKDEDSGTLYLAEYFSGLSHTNMAKLYTLADLIRKFSILLTLIFLKEWNIFVRVGVICAIQSLFTIYLILFRPFELTRDNLKELLIEIMIFIYTVLFIFMAKKQSWEQIIAKLYVYFVVANIAITTIISAFCLCKDFIQKLKFPKRAENKVTNIDLPKKTQKVADESRISKISNDKFLRQNQSSKFYRQSNLYKIRNEINSIQPHLNSE
ncbi:unnamed protein product [Moneuplotes crassus]|uniref:PA14 domain-containing protein n=1 Tax=Euplotes crassus TaxID=5936 RepID=A0AAD1XSQ8_EUPCR|nr:unnamed protein product [Moneuplotes crassus]